MKKSFSALLLLALVAVQNSNAGQVSTIVLNFGSNYAGDGWRLFVRNDAGTGSTDWIELVNGNWTNVYIMRQADVSPSFFALTYNTLKDAFVSKDKVVAELTYESTNPATGRTLYRVSLIPRNP